MKLIFLLYSPSGATYSQVQVAMQGHILQQATLSVIFQN